MATTRVIMDQAAIDRMFKSPAGDVARMLARKAVTVEGAAKRLCPVDTGRLRSSITHGMSTDAQGLLAWVGTNVNYALFVELGTRYVRAQPFLRPALRSVR